VGIARLPDRRGVDVEALEEGEVAPWELSIDNNMNRQIRRVLPHGLDALEELEPAQRVLIHPIVQGSALV
jgi:hypothetical protein